MIDYDESQFWQWFNCTLYFRKDFSDNNPLDK